MKKYVVLGGNGFIGRNLVNKLSRDNHVLVADRTYSPEFEAMNNISYKKFNFTEEESFAPLLDGADTIIHLVSTLFAKDGTENLAPEVSANVLSTIRLLEDIAGRNVNLLFVSSGGTVYGEGGEFPALEDDSKHAFCGYALTKMMIENTLELYQNQHGLRYQTVRLSNPYGFMSNSGRMQGLIPIIVNRVLHGEPITIWGDGENIRDYIFIDDVVDAIAAVLNYEGDENIFNVGTGVGYSINEILNLVIEKLSPEKPPVIQYSSSRKCDIRKNVLNIERITKCTGWKPKTGIEEGIELVIRESRTKIRPSFSAIE
ncbi:NAD-dependent epimerase/dehydratase family protein [Paenibacillus macerans]|uniref:3-beta hydroxysteroid dehydrogenase/isomerase family protein n=1 Tax=Paenibacillus macerans TaxID=44252 RepID=A0A090ZUD6_PAEMA|nr:NAD-dependent epimerase/dehydratase family protein [Paenibacillus macerans]KFN07746.1 3-beta hydroxysteroid dehydrogenase/isomerase family protein [Paenibacillus macerans]MCY7561606.1 NAD-dependent epimerase/dehydratase family protein [Paenibacillus macerans]MEC0153360.1 NAD-dependent epimerase/dehydratase family protein [Paenibacillus macerans]SUD25910.1 NAD-dependent epimerase/dehydratase [Paenibacillus macerans]GBK65183.1 UDP-glucose 4-epimerase [Paenibacillus macerans]